jgi:2-amino-4-hydroxy-6-hydroxymethyldihydropteridine diphosphokinase
MPEVYVGCGSNIDPEPNLRWAIAELGRQFAPLICSSVYESPAFGFSGPDFLNMVVGFSVAGDADSVESILSTLENRRGRSVANRSGSRTLDLDLLLFGCRVDARRRLPRSDILLYPFVLVPLAEIAPGLRHPLTGVTIEQSRHEAAGDGTPLTCRGSLDAA